MIHLSSLKDLEDAIAASHRHPVMILKHSTRCPVSYAADGEFRQFVQSSEGTDVQFCHLDLIKHRDVSNAIASELGVTHQSPQAILISAGQAVWHASHGSITRASLADAIGK